MNPNVIDPNSSIGLIFFFAIALIGVFFFLLIGVISWLGTRLYNKVDEMSKNISSMSNELHGRITDIDNRVTFIEAIESTCPASPRRRMTDKKD